jgi:hypothetical protein
MQSNHTLGQVPAQDIAPVHEGGSNHINVQGISPEPQVEVSEHPANYAYSFFVGSCVDDARMDPYEFRVYAHLIRRAGGAEGKATCGLTEIARVCAMSRGQAHDAVHKLSGRKAIEISKYFDPKKNQERNCYVVTDRRDWCPEPKIKRVSTVHTVNSTKKTVHAVNSTIHAVNSNCSYSESKVIPLKENPEKGNLPLPPSGGNGRARLPFSFDGFLKENPSAIPDGCVDASRAWVEHRNEIQVPLTDRAFKVVLQHAADWGPERFAAAVDRCIQGRLRILEEPSKINGYSRRPGARVDNGNSEAAEAARRDGREMVEGY